MKEETERLAATGESPEVAARRATGASPVGASPVRGDAGTSAADGRARG